MFGEEYSCVYDSRGPQGWLDTSAPPLETKIYKLEKELNSNLPNSVVIRSVYVPKDVLVGVFSHIKTNTWNSLKRTCKAFYNVSNSMHLPQDYYDPWRKVVKYTSVESAKILSEAKIKPRDKRYLTEHFIRAITKEGHHHKNRKRLLEVSSYLIPFLTEKSWMIHWILETIGCKDDIEHLNICLKYVPGQTTFCRSQLFKAAMAHNSLRCFDVAEKCMVKHGYNPLLNTNNCNSVLYLRLVKTYWERTFLHILDDENAVHRIFAELIRTEFKDSKETIKQMLEHISQKKRNLLLSLFTEAFTEDNLPVVEIFVESEYVIVGDCMKIIMDIAEPVNVTAWFVENDFFGYFKPQKNYISKAVDADNLCLLKYLLDENDKCKGKAKYVDMGLKGFQYIQKNISDNESKHKSVAVYIMKRYRKELSDNDFKKYKSFQAKLLPFSTKKRAFKEILSDKVKRAKQ